MPRGMSPDRMLGTIRWERSANWLGQLTLFSIERLHNLTFNVQAYDNKWCDEVDAKNVRQLIGSTEDARRGLEVWCNTIWWRCAALIRIN